MYKIYIKMFFVILISIILSACEEEERKEDQNVIKLLVWQTYKYKEDQMFLEQARRFSEDYKKRTGKDVEIISKRVPFDDLETNIRTACLANKTPDIARVDALKVLEFAYHKILVPLDTLQNFKGTIEEKSKEFMEGAFQTNVIDIKGEKHIFGLPEQTTCLALFWNRKMFREAEDELVKAGLDPKRAPKTWDELIEYGKVLTREVNGEKKFGFAMNNSLWWTLPFFGCYNAPFIESGKDGKKYCSLEDPRTVAALQLKVDIYQKYKVEGGAWKAGALGPDVGFANEKYAMILMGPWYVEKYRNAGLDFGIALIPKISKEEAENAGVIPKGSSDEIYAHNVTSATNVGGNNMVIFRSCRYPEVAYEFIDYLASQEAQLRWCRELKQIPVNKRAADALINDTQTDPDIRIFMEQIQFSKPPPRIPRYGYLEGDILNPEMELALKQEKSVKDALKDAARKADAKILSLVNE